MPPSRYNSGYNTLIKNYRCRFGSYDAHHMSAESWLYIMDDFGNAVIPWVYVDSEPQTPQSAYYF